MFVRYKNMEMFAGLILYNRFLIKLMIIDIIYTIAHKVSSTSK